MGFSSDFSLEADVRAGGRMAAAQIAVPMR